jgi:hypothetical protein
VSEIVESILLSSEGKSEPVKNKQSNTESNIIDDSSKKVSSVNTKQINAKDTGLVEEMSDEIVEKSKLSGTNKKLKNIIKIVDSETDSTETSSKSNESNSRIVTTDKFASKSPKPHENLDATELVGTNHLNAKTSKNKVTSVVVDTDAESEAVTTNVNTEIGSNIGTNKISSKNIMKSAVEVVEVSPDEVSSKTVSKTLSKNKPSNSDTIDTDTVQLVSTSTSTSTTDGKKKTSALVGVFDEDTGTETAAIASAPAVPKKTKKTISSHLSCFSTTKIQEKLVLTSLGSSSGRCEHIS